MKVPKDFPVQPLRRGSNAFKDAERKAVLATCGECGRSWDDSQETDWTPCASSARCPFEYFH